MTPSRPNRAEDDRSLRTIFLDHDEKDERQFTRIMTILLGDGDDQLGVCARLERMEQAEDAHRKASDEYRKGVKTFVYWILTPVLGLLVVGGGALLVKLFQLKLATP